MQWIEFPDDRLPVFGLPFFAENSPELWRLPRSRKDQYREPVWDLGLSPAGGRIRFTTDSAALAVRLDYGNVGHMNNMHRIGQHAVDCYVDGRFWSHASPLEGNAEVEVTLFSGQAAAPRAIDLYLPLYHPVRVLAVGVADGATVAAPPAFAVELPVVYYGSSITQGGCASHSGNSYQGFVSRMLNLDQVNLGFSGNGRGEAEVAQTVADIDASVYVVDYSQNCPTVEEMRDTYTPFLATIRRQHPDTPILCVSPIFCASESWNPGAHDGLEAKRQVVRDAVAARQAGGDRRIEVVEGYDLLGPAQADGLVDAAHPNDLGFRAMANGLAGPLAKALGLPEATACAR